MPVEVMRIVGMLLIASTFAVSAMASPYQPNEKKSVFKLSGEYGNTEEYSGKLGKFHYSYMVAHGEVLNGVVNGPMKGVSGLADYDPDRWVAARHVDKMTDAVSWTITHYATGLLLTVDATGETVSSVCMLEHDFPGKQFAVRVGKNLVHTFSEKCAPGDNRLLSELKQGGPFLVRKVKWPDAHPIDKEGNADTFQQLLKLYTWLRTYPH